jgi:hypothetical protein
MLTPVLEKPGSVASAMTRSPRSRELRPIVKKQLAAFERQYCWKALYVPSAALRSPLRSAASRACASAPEPVQSLRAPELCETLRAPPGAARSSGSSSAAS